MKLLAPILVVILLVGCGEESKLPQSLCDCFDVQMEMMNEFEGKEMDDALVEEIELKYEAEFDACDRLAKAFEEKTKDLPQEEQVEAQQELMADCDAYQEYVKQNEAMMQQQMQNQENPFEGMSEEEIQELLQGAADEELNQLETE